MVSEKFRIEIGHFLAEVCLVPEVFFDGWVVEYVRLFEFEIYDFTIRSDWSEDRFFFEKYRSITTDR